MHQASKGSRSLIMRSTCAGVAAVMACLATEASAQAAASGDGARLDEIIVTAQKRSENLQDVPIAVSAVSSEQIQSLNIKTARDLGNVVPGLIYSQAGGTTQTFLRGIGTTITQVNADPSVATYIDGVYISLSTVTAINLADIASVEVLKGPQGTLYGRNATGGAISLTTRSPRDKFEGSAYATVANFERREVGGSLSGPIANHLYLGVYGSFDRRQPYSELQNAPGVAKPDVRDHDFQGSARGKLVYDDDDKLRVVLSGDITRYGALQDMAWRQLQRDAEGYGSTTIGRRAVVNPGEYSFSTNAPVDNNWTAKGGSLRIDYDLGAVKLASISAYRDNRSYTNADGDGTDAAVAAVVVALTNKSKQLTQEFQIQSDNSGPLKWILGAFYYNDKGKLDPFHIQPPSFDQTITAGANTESVSGYGQATWMVTDQLGFTLGGRYTDETKDYTGGVSVRTAAPAAPVVTRFAARSSRYKNFNPRIGVEYHLGDNTMLFANYSQAFKSGVFNLNGTTDLAIGPVDPEELDAYEGGFKSELFDRRLRLNTTYFHYDFKNLQVQTIDRNGISSLQNAAAAESDGLDIDSEFAVTSRLRATAKILLLDSTYKSFPAFQGKIPRDPNTPGSTRGGNIDVPGGVNLTGKRAARSPKFTGSFGGNYTFPFSNGGELVVNGNVFHSSSFNFNPDATVRQDAYSTVSGSIEYSPPGKAWAVSVWSNNIGDAYYYTYKQINANGTYGIPAASRTFGATVRVRLGEE